MLHYLLDGPPGSEKVSPSNGANKSRALEPSQERETTPVLVGLQTTLYVCTPHTIVHFA